MTANLTERLRWLATTDEINLDQMPLGFSEDMLEAADEIETLRDALAGLEPHLDAITCYASTMAEHEPNRLVANARAALAFVRGGEAECYTPAIGD